MPAYLRSTRFTLILSLLATGIALVWLLAVPSTFNSFGTLLVGALVAAFATVAVITYKNAQANGSMAQIIHDVDVAATPEPAVVRPAAAARRKA